MELRPYQSRTIERLWSWLAENDEGHPVIVLPTGSGKSVIIAAFCKQILGYYPNVKILVLAHVKELIEQNSNKMRQWWPNAPIGVFSAGLGKKEIGEPITFAGIQSIRNLSAEVGWIDIIMVDEADLISHKDEGGYRTLINELLDINPALRVIGLTATPYRMGHGIITQEPAIFKEPMIEGATIEELIHLGHLAPLHSKHSKLSFDVQGVGKRGGEFIESELQKRVNTDANNVAVVGEVVVRADKRKSWLIFCSGIEHAQAIADLLNDFAIPTGCVTGKTSNAERDKIINDFKSGKLKAVTNANVLTVGFDYPDIDMIVFLRPTMSRRLYMQMAGRGLRPKSHTDHCLVLDFAGNVERHGPITVEPHFKKKNGSEPGIAPQKICPICDEIVGLPIMLCPECGHEFEVKEKEEDDQRLRNDNIMREEGKIMEVADFHWRIQNAKKGGIPMIVVDYRAWELTHPRITEFFCVCHTGYAQKKGIESLNKLVLDAGLSLDGFTDIESMVEYLNASGRKPETMEYKKGKDGYWEVLCRTWPQQKTEKDMDNEW